MEDIMEEPVMDIDTPDANDPLAVAEYIEDLYSYYRKVEVHLESIFYNTSLIIWILFKNGIYEAMT